MRRIRDDLLVQFTVAGFVVILALAIGIATLISTKLNDTIRLLMEHGQAMMDGAQIMPEDPYSMPSIRSNVERLKFQVVVALGIGFAVLYTSLVAIVARGWRTIRGQRQDLLETNEELQTRNHHITLLNQMGDLLQASLTAEDAYQVLKDFGAKLFPSESGVLYMMSASRNYVEAATTWGKSLPDERVFSPSKCWALRRGQPYLSSADDSKPLCKHLADLANGGWYLCVPMMAQGDALGILHVNGTTPDEVHPGQVAANQAKEQLALAMADHVGLALANLQLKEALRVQSIRDPLTGLFNRRYMEETLELELHRAKRDDRPVGVLMADIDHFKRFNDTYGHVAGDVLLRAMGQLLRTSTRAGDIACRYGGEEFALILPGASLDNLRARGEQIRQGVKNMSLELRGQTLGEVSISIGAAAYPDYGTSVEDLLERADAALYKAKSSGRDCVVTADHAA